MEDQSLTSEDCQKILEKHSSGSVYISHSLKSLAEEVEGYLSSHYSLKITYQDPGSVAEKIQSFFVKKMNQNCGFLTELAKSFDAFTKETFFYQFYPKLRSLENFAEFEFAPKFFLSKENLIVIEDLSEGGFRVSEKNVPFSLEECKVALETLARFHGSFLAYEELESKKLGRRYDLSLEFSKELKDLTRNSEENSAVRRYLKVSNDVILALVEIIQDETIDKKAFKNLLQNDNLEKNHQYLPKYRKCLLHCDLWSKNFMFQKKNHQILNCKLVDFQLLNYSLPGYDLAQFLNANTSPEFQKIHKEALLQYYYNSLESILKRFGLPLEDIMSSQDFLDGYILCEPSAKIFSFNDSAVLRLPEEILVQAFGNVELLEEFLIEKRVDLISDLYKNNADFNKWVHEELRDLYDCLRVKEEFIRNNGAEL